jgi:hypothetical protein
MRRVLWNIYAWPISVLILLGFLSELSMLRTLSAVDFALSIPALTALHLHVWDARFLSSAFWKPYAFIYITWDVYYNMAINPMHFSKPVLLVLPVVALPLYVALFRYAFRSWSLQRA